MDVESLIEDLDNYVVPQGEQQLAVVPPTYEQSLEDATIQGLNVDPEYFAQPDDLPPTYNEDEGIDYTLD